jgi:hypothetical protein
MGIEDPDADVAEQLRPALPTDDEQDGDEPAEAPGSLPIEADPADVAEQREVVPEDDFDDLR